MRAMARAQALLYGPTLFTVSSFQVAGYSNVYLQMATENPAGLALKLTLFFSDRRWTPHLAASLALPP